MLTRSLWVRGSFALHEASKADSFSLGAFEHYATLHPHETTLRRFEAANEWLGHYDILSSTSRSGQEFALLAYLSYAIVPLFHHLAACGNPKVEKQNLYWEVRIIVVAILTWEVSMLNLRPNSSVLYQG
jgi:chromosome transmission fidelity protein 18